MEEDIYVLNALLQQYFSLYQARYNSLCILKFVSIQIQLALELYILYTRTKTSDYNKTESISNWSIFWI